MPALIHESVRLFGHCKKSIMLHNGITSMQGKKWYLLDEDDCSRAITVQHVARVANSGLFSRAVASDCHALITQNHFETSSSPLHFALKPMEGVI